MKNDDSPNLVVMLTHNDMTVKNASEIFENCKDSKAKFWGFKEEPLSIEENDYYRVSKIYRNTIDKNTGKQINKELIWDNHSLVMFDPILIPEEMIVS